MKIWLDVLLEGKPKILYVKALPSTTVLIFKKVLSLTPAG